MPFALTLTDQGSFELGERAPHRQHQCGHRGVIPGEGELFLHELDLHAADGGTQVVEIAGETFHQVNETVSPSRTKAIIASICGR